MSIRRTLTTTQRWSSIWTQSHNPNVRRTLTTAQRWSSIWTQSHNPNVPRTLTTAQRWSSIWTQSHNPNVQRTLTTAQRWSSIWTQSRNPACVRSLLHKPSPLDKPLRVRTRLWKPILTKYTQQLEEFKQQEKARIKEKSDDTRSDVAVANDAKALEELKKLENRAALEKFINESKIIQVERKKTIHWYIYFATFWVLLALLYLKDNYRRKRELAKSILVKKGGETGMNSNSTSVT